jgi:UDP-N-acetylmuramyl tripeptide synthase
MYGGTITISELPAVAELLDFELGVATDLTLRIGELTEAITLRAEGAHNAQNAVAAAALALTFGLGPAAIAEGLRDVEPAFGRGQSFEIEGRRVVLQLVKNPAGFRQSLRTVDGLRPAATVIAINDDYADGRDMSWLWDVEFAAALGSTINIPRSPQPVDAPAPPAKAGWLVTSGSRAADMAVRLQYDEIAVDLVQPDLAVAVREATFHVKPSDTVVVFSTYTAMWQLHRVLEKIAAV